MISFSRLTSLPRYYLGILGVPVIAGLSFLSGSWVIVLVVFFTLLILFFILWICLHLWKKKKGSELSNMLRKDADSVEVSGIESMRSNFEAGVEKLHKANKNVYDLPWFLLAGQAGSGKTEAIRRSHAKEDFPPGLNDLMQGVGGTLNMNWWFTNKGIILDTAGRVFEEKVTAGKTNEWQEFLKMLKKARKNMPINGFILTISADSLIRDDFSVIEEKASHIAEQITLVQNVLGVRFPVFILVTKSDFIPGFREFVENITEPNLQQQMLGWSNPNGLDEPFVPEQVDEYLDDVIAKLKKRRLTYLLDPRAHADKRLDDLDSLFTFPNELRAAIPNLRRYIEIVFSLNPWSQKPLFIRGIYFTSSLQQGDALDKALAEVMGKKLGDMALSSFKKETPLFLRDSFFHKIYRESGLVTSSGEVKSAMRRRTMIFTCACLMGVSAILAAAWFGSRSFRRNIGDEYAHWKFAEGEYRESSLQGGAAEWSRPIVYDIGLGDAFETDKDVSFDVSTKTYTLPTYLGQMATYARSELEVPGVFRPLKFFDDMFTGDSIDRESAVRSLYEDAVVLPILVNAREKLRAATQDSWGESNAAGLHSLIQVQILLNQADRSSGYADSLFKQLDALYNFLTEDRLGPELEQLYADFYTDDYIASSGWPNETFSRHYAAIDDLRDDGLAAISHGLDLWINEISEIRVRQENDMSRLVGLLQGLEDVAQAESIFLSKTTKSGSIKTETVSRLDDQYTRFLNSTQDLNTDGQSFTFTGYYLQQINQAKENVDTRVNDLNTGVNRSAEGGGRLSQAILERVDEQRNELVTSFDRLADPKLLQRFEDADQNYLNPDNGLTVRLSLYRALDAYLAQLKAINLQQWSTAAELLEDLRGQHQSVAAAISSADYSEPQQVTIDKLKVLAGQGLNRAKSRLFKQYQQLLLAELKQLIGFPVFADSQRMLSKRELAELSDELRKVSDNIVQFKAAMEETQSDEFERMLESLQNVDLFIQSNLTPELMEETVGFEFAPLADLRSSSIRDTVVWRARLVQLSGIGEPVRMAKQSRTLGDVELAEEVLNIFFTSTADGQAGDVGRVRISGGWAALQLLLRQQDAIKSVGNGKYMFQGTLALADYKTVGYRLLLDFPESVPDADEWLRTSDLKGF